MTLRTARQLFETEPSTSRKRILTVIPYFAVAGAERVVANLLAAMQPELFDYHLVTLRSRPGQQEHCLPSHVQRSILDSARVETAIIALARCLRRLRPHLICSHIAGMNVVTALAVALSRIRARLVLVDHHVATDSIVSAGPFHALLPVAMRWAYRRSDCIVGVSTPVLQNSLHVVRSMANKGRVIPNPVVFPRLLALSEESADHPWFDQPQYEVVLGVGRLVLFKNFELLIEAFGLVAAHRPLARLIIVGSGPLHSFHDAHIHRLGLESLAQLIGFRANPFPLIRRAKTVVVTSHSEGLSTVLIEAMACGTPVVATEFSSVREALPGWGPKPVPFTAQAVANAIEHRLDHPGDPQSLMAWASRFAVRPIAARYEQLFLELLEGHDTQRSIVRTPGLFRE
jgi:glycosyltransferase involved in cell wall biosynthesis